MSQTPKIRRINVIGTSGSGKSTLARRLAAALDAPHIELDALHWRPNWQERPRDDTARELAALVAAPRWIVDGNYSHLRPLIWPKVDAVVWIDLPLWRNLWNVVARSVRRATTRERLWGHSVETLGRLVGPESIALWVLRSHARHRRTYEQAFRDWPLPGDAPLCFRLRSYGEIEQFLAALDPRSKGQSSWSHLSESRTR